MAKKKNNKAGELIRSYQEFAHSTMIPTYWEGRKAKLDYYSNLWRGKPKQLARKDGIIPALMGLFTLLITCLVTWAIREGK